MKRKSLLLTVMAALLTIGSLTANAQSDYQEIDVTSGKAMSGYGTPTFSNGSTITFTDGGRWFYDLRSIECSTYKYLVIVPRKPRYSEIKTNEVVTLQKSLPMHYGLMDKSNHDLNYWGYADYNTNREFVYNLKANCVYDYYDVSSSADMNARDRSLAASDTKTTMDIDNLTYLYLLADGNTGTFDISSIFLTNAQPAYDNRYNFVNADYKRDITENDKYGTICLPYVASICGADAYKVVGVDSKTNPTKLYIKEVVGLLEKGTPYIFKTNTQKYADNNGGYVTFLRASKVANDLTDPVTTATGLVGSFTDSKDVPDDCYILTNNTWAKGTKNVIDANRAYLDVSKLNEVEGAASYTAVDLTGGVVTGINAVKSDKTDSKTVYNLNGMSVSNPTKGLYIENGKKVIIK